MNEFEKDIIVKAGDKKSIEEFCNATWQPLYRYIYYKVQNKEEAEDIIQETYIKAISYMQKNHINMNKCMAFLKTVALNVLRDRWRKNKRKGKVINLDEVTLKEDRIEDSTENMIQREIIENALGLLNDEQRTVIELRILKGYSVADTAKAMNKKEGTVRVLQYRALQNLRKVLKKDY
ncbi:MULTISPECIES: RNA polymerase sigma factor [Clostridium]|uniref:RNA polymerase sigma factor n=2 Tax=Clostridium TaxID=1485 RepID=A0A151AKS0_9CLOT|nr:MULTISPECIES: RNA polymerase sigma factor [Clostridium]KYH28218.1 ECF RNA polymerase sigma factor SigL [Clostridium colicanis DSM 13634]MBE6044291.1 RNA polymerase sigma factor [Clostridium thermopalmarium]PRR76578.1 ECF RNA polymerase sigma factor SigL [Clostridium thermopalmarium DSM 5974]PVZ28309.1 RNA polymerase sigma-70 factor (ECF subfamily) [Clostridium thermopalmarium DSM 5974]